MFRAQPNNASPRKYIEMVARFKRWSLDKRLRSMSSVPDSAFLRARQTVTVTIDFCNWLAGKHSTIVDQLSQARIDLWRIKPADV